MAYSRQAGIHNQSPLDLALADLIAASDPASGWQSIVDALRTELGATAVELTVSRPAERACAGEIPDVAPSLFDLKAGGRVYGRLAVWAPEAAFTAERRARLTLLAGVIGMVRERDCLRKEGEQFVYSVTHDLRGVIVRASNMAQLLGQLGQFSEDGQQLRSFLTQSLSAGESLLRELAVYAKAGSSPDAPARVTVKALLEAVRWQVKPELSKKGITLQIAESERFICVREAEMIDVLRRIVDNSARYGASRVTVGAGEDDGGILLNVDDDGPGIEPAYAETVFEPLRRLHGSEIPGNGLGLPIARKLVERQGGRIWVEPRPGPGTTVQVWLPEAVAP